MPDVVLGRRSVKYELFVFFVDGIVGEMLEVVAKILLVWRLVGLRREPGHTLLIDVDSQRVDPGQQNIYSQVELQRVDQIGFRNISLDDVLLVFRYLAWLPDQKYS